MCRWIAVPVLLLVPLAGAGCHGSDESDNKPPVALTAQINDKAPEAQAAPPAPGAPPGVPSPGGGMRKGMRR